MPRGVYARKGSKKSAATRKPASVRRAPASATVEGVLAPSPAASKPILPLKAKGTEPKAITAKTHAQLRAYAASIGIRKSDIENLSMSRLQQNCMVRVAEMMED